MANELETQQRVGITGYLSSEKVKQNIMQVVGEKNTIKFISSVVSAVQSNNDLAVCTNNSILSAALLGQALNLTPSPQLGQYYMVPYKNKKKDENGNWIEVKEAQFQLGTKGYVQLAVRSGQYRKLVVSEVKEGELDFYNPITEDFKLNSIENEVTREKLPTVGYYAMFELVNGFRKELYWSKEKMEEHARTYSSGYRNDINKNTAYTFWSKNFDDMGKKTMLRQLISKWGIMSIEMQRAFESDMAVLQDDLTPNYVDNQAQPIETDGINFNDLEKEAEEVFK